MHLLTIRECVKQTGIGKSTIYRWLAAKKLRRRKDGLVDLNRVTGIKERKTVGRAHGIPEIDRIYGQGLLEGTAQPLASPYLDGPRGLALWESVCGLVIAHHSKTPYAREKARDVLTRLYALL